MINEYNNIDITEKDSSLSWKEMEKEYIIEFIKRRKWFYNREIYRECLIVLEKLKLINTKLYSYFLEKLSKEHLIVIERYKSWKINFDAISTIEKLTR